MRVQSRQIGDGRTSHTDSHRPDHPILGRHQREIGGQVNDLSAQALAEVGATVDGHQPRQLTDELMQTADLVVVVGTADVTPPDGVALEVWNTDEPPNGASTASNGCD